MLGTTSVKPPTVGGAWAQGSLSLKPEDDGKASGGGGGSTLATGSPPPAAKKKGRSRTKAHPCHHGKYADINNFVEKLCESGASPVGRGEGNRRWKGQGRR